MITNGKIKTSMFFFLLNSCRCNAITGWNWTIFIHVCGEEEKKNRKRLSIVDFRFDRYKFEMGGSIYTTIHTRIRLNSSQISGIELFTNIKILSIKSVFVRYRQRKITSSVSFWCNGRKGRIICRWKKQASWGEESIAYGLKILVYV